jgi:hypothetical protein
MLNECLENKEYVDAFDTKGQQYSAKSLFMALIFQQQKTISKLIESLEVRLLLSRIFPMNRSSAFMKRNADVI